MADFNIIIPTFITNLFRTFIIKRFMTVFFRTQTAQKRMVHLVYFSFFFFTALLHILFHYPPLNIVSNLVFLYLITQVYEGSQKKKILITFLIYIIHMTCDIFSMYACNNYILGETYPEFSAYFTIFLIAITEFVIERYVMKNKEHGFVPPCWKLLLGIPVISVIILLILIMADLRKQWILVSVSACLLFINMLIFYLYDVLVAAYVKLEEGMVFKHQADSYANQLEILMQSEAKLNSLKHDLKHHLIELMNMSEDSENTSSITTYIQAMQKELQNSQEYAETGNKDVDSLLNFMLEKAKAVLTCVECKLYIPNDIKIHTYDFNVIIGNLLENAITAASQSEKKWLSVSISYEKELMFIRIQNSYNGERRKKNGTYLTTKQDKNIHGIGLQNVRRIVEENNGSLQITDDNHIFDVRIMLYL